AEKALAALQQMSAAQANVIRDGKPASVAAAELVPGDIVIIEQGSTIPADGRLIKSSSLQTSEAALTGESEPVSKHTKALDKELGIGERANMVFSGTTATYGRGVAVVTATGMRSEMGRIATL